MTDTAGIDVSGTITRDEAQTHVTHPFEVGAGTTRIEVTFEHGPDRPPGSPHTHELSLSLYDPAGGRGARHNNPDHRIVLTDGAASKGYTPGPLTPGRWVVSIDVHRIIPPGAVSYRLQVETSTAPQSPPPPPVLPGSCKPRGPGWYRGDLHGHSLHSDAPWDIAAFVDEARRIGLDFVTLTDHNTVSGVAECLSLAGDDLLVMGGSELTTFWGHCLAVGHHGWIDWRTGDSRPMKAIAAEVVAKGGLFIIAHPTMVGHPWCSGCDWRYADTSPGLARVVEVWNSDWSGEAHNEKALALYYTWLTLGHRMVATAGSDTHGPFEASARPGYNVVYCADLRADAVRAGIARGHLYLSSGPRLEFTAAAGATTAGMGASLDATEATVSIRWADAPPDATIRLVRQSDTPSGPCGYEAIGNGPDGARQIGFSARPGRDWATVEVRDATGALHAVTNPIFFGDWPP